MHLLMIILQVYFWTDISSATEDQGLVLGRNKRWLKGKDYFWKDELQETDGIRRIRSTGLGYLLQ